MDNIEKPKMYLVVKIIDGETLYDNLFNSKEKADLLKNILRNELWQKYNNKEIEDNEVEVIELTIFD